MRSEPAPAKVVGEAFHYLRDWQAAGVGCNDCSLAPHGFNFLQQVAFDVEVFDDGFNDPINFGELLQIVFKISDCDHAGQR